MGTNAKIMYDGKNAITGFLSVFTYFVYCTATITARFSRLCDCFFVCRLCRPAYVLVTNFVRPSIIRREAAAADNILYYYTHREVVNFTEIV